MINEFSERIFCKQLWFIGIIGFQAFIEITKMCVYKLHKLI